MCPNEKIPSVNRIQHIQSYLKATEHSSPEGQDIFALERPHGTADDVIDRFNLVTSNMDASRVQENLLNLGRIRMPYSLPSDYENIFQNPALSRRADRPVPTNRQVASQDVQQLMYDWVLICIGDSSPDVDHFVPGDMEQFTQLMLRSMPARLTFGSWVGRLLMNAASQEINEEILMQGEVREWNNTMPSDEVLYHRLQSGLLQDVVYFAGEAKPGRLVWVPHQRFDLKFSHGRAFCKEVRAKLREAEVAFLALSRRIARHIASIIVYQYAMPEAERRGCSILNRKQIGKAVREILGDAWFELPFDLDRSLQDWSEDDVLKPDDEMHGTNVFLGDDGDED